MQEDDSQTMANDPEGANDDVVIIQSSSSDDGDSRSDTGSGYEGDLEELPPVTVTVSRHESRREANEDLEIAADDRRSAVLVATVGVDSRNGYGTRLIFSVSRQTS